MQLSSKMTKMTKMTQGIQSANIYPNLIALSALVEKKDAKVRVDVRCFAV